MTTTATKVFHVATFGGQYTSCPKVWIWARNGAFVMSALESA
jgi:hypothetical protein